MSGADGYIIQRSNISSTTGYSDCIRIDGEGTTVTADVMTSADVGKTYYYRICSYLDNGSYVRSSYSNVVTITVLPKYPSPITATINSASGVLIQWGSVAGSTGYYVYRSTTAGGTFSLIANITGGTLHYNNNSVTSGQTYYYKVRAYQIVGGKTYLGAMSSAVKCVASIGTPVIWYWNAISTYSARIDWGPVPGASGYKIYRDSGSGTEEVGDITGLRFIDTSLTVNQTYVYTVAAYKTISGSKNIGKRSGAKTVTTTISTVTGIVSSPLSTSSVKLKWNIVAGATGYEVQISDDPMTGFSTYAKVGSNTCTVTGLPNATYKYFRIRAYVTKSSDTSNGAWSSTATGFAGPTAPNGLRPATVTSNSVKLVWNAVEGASGYSVQYFAPGASSWTVATVVVGKETTTYNVTGLVGASTYKFRVFSVCTEATTGDKRSCNVQTPITVKTR